MSDEEVIKRSLLFDGDGTGDERRLHVLHRTVIKLCNSQESPQELADSFDRIMVQLSQCEFSVKKSKKVAAMNAIELENYQNLSKKITLDIEEEKKKIEKTKLDLIDAKRIRKNKMEYDVLGKVISQQPDRKKSEAELNAVQAELTSLRAVRNDVLQKLAARKRQFHGLVLLLHQLQNTMQDLDQGPTAPADDLQMEVEVIDDSS